MKIFQMSYSFEEVPTYYDISVAAEPLISTVVCRIRSSAMCSNNKSKGPDHSRLLIHTLPC